ncbi:DcrB-related protein [Xenorhabdus griffiniae]|uniref:DcrB-related protein n=1 Tax=Xenorhabdus griffiniae TaxID=351672 RepID=UPI0030CA85BE
MNTQTDQINEGTLAIPDNWRDESISPEGEMHQTVVLQIQGNLLLAFNLTSPQPFDEGQRNALLAVVSSFQAT